jgi:hypothetical protein
VRAGLLVCCCDGSELGDKAQGSQDNLNLEEKRATFSRHFLKTVRAGDFSSLSLSLSLCVCVCRPPYHLGQRVPTYRTQTDRHAHVASDTGYACSSSFESASEEWAPCPHCTPPSGFPTQTGICTGGTRLPEFAAPRARASAGRLHRGQCRSEGLPGMRVREKEQRTRGGNKAH